MTPDDDRSRGASSMNSAHHPIRRRRAAKPMSAEDLLVEWGLWLSHTRSPTSGYLSPAMAMVAENTGAAVCSLPPHTIDDDLAITVDRAVARLMEIHHRQGHGLVMYFSWRWSYRQIGNRWQMNKNQVQQTIQKAVSWVGGRLDAEFSPIDNFDCPDRN